MILVGHVTWKCIFSDLKIFEVFTIFGFVNLGSVHYSRAGGRGRPGGRAGGRKGRRTDGRLQNFKKWFFKHEKVVLKLQHVVLKLETNFKQWFQIFKKCGVLHKTRVFEEGG